MKFMDELLRVILYNIYSRT